MESNIDERLRAIEERLEENTQIVKKIRRAQKTAETIRAMYWIFIILLGLGAFYFISPIMEQFKEVYNIGNASNTGNFNELLNQFKEYQSDL